jgi:type VI secretion system protein ImpH
VAFQGGGEVGGVTDELIEALEREFYSFDALQLVAVIGEILEDGDTAKRIYFEADASLSFPPSDVGDVAVDSDGNGVSATIRLPVMNLLGSSSPLPLAFSDYIARGRPDADMYADFLSIMQNRLHALWLDAQQKHALWGGGGAVAKKIFESMTGLQVDKVKFYENALAGLGQLSSRARGARGLLELLRMTWEGIPISIEENVGRYAAVSNAKPLGGAARLGRNAAAGSRVYDRTSTFRITVGPLDGETYKTFMPDGGNYRLINEIVSVYINEPVICELEVTCKLRDLPRARLGGAQGGGNEAGRTAVLGDGGGKTAAYLKQLGQW